MLVPTATIQLTTASGMPWTLIGRSWAADGTSLAIPELKLLFDCGAPIIRWPPAVALLSHTHNDHIQSIHLLKSPRNPPTLHVPTEAAPFLERYFHAHQELSDCLTEAESQGGGTYKETIKLVSHDPEEEFVFRQRGQEYVCRTLACDHRIPCLGYSLHRRQHKLKDEFKGLPGQEIGQLRKQGVEITKSVEEPLVCLMGDTTTRVFETYPDVLVTHDVVVVECTFIHDTEISNAEQHKHVHWSSLRPFIEQHPSTLFVLIHFSVRHSASELRRFFVENTPHRNVHPLLLEDDLLRESHQSSNPIPLPPCNCFRCSPNESR